VSQDNIALARSGAESIDIIKLSWSPLLIGWRGNWPVPATALGTLGMQLETLKSIGRKVKSEFGAVIGNLDCGLYSVLVNEFFM
jgi:hypothetical protein